MKQIIAKDMKQAMVMAREELGEDAVLLSSRKQAGNKGVIVTFATEDELFEETFAAPIEHPSNDNESGTNSDFDDYDEGYDGDDNAYDAADANHIVNGALGSSLASKARSFPEKPPESQNLKVPRSSYPAYELLLSILNHHRMPESLYINITALLDKIDIPAQLSYHSCAQIFTTVLTPNIALKPLDISDTKQRNRAWMFVGPYGSGKTTLIAKLATQAHMQNIPVSLISTDTEKMGATAALEELTQVLGCSFTMAESRAELRALLNEKPADTLMLIDSPGVNIYDFQEMKTLGECASLKDIEPILTCPAGLDPDEATELASVFSFLSITRFALTKADSARHFAAAYALLNNGYALACATDSAKPSAPIALASHALLSELSCAYIRERMAL
jgi:flagellar biosynthesis protein FlhF